MNRDKDKIVMFIFGVIIIILGYMVTTCNATPIVPKPIERCYQVTPSVMKCYSTDGSVRTIIRV